MNLESLFLRVPPGERLARLRSLRLAVALLVGPRGRRLEQALVDAEADESAIPAVVEGVEALLPLDRRSVLAALAVSLAAPKR